MIWLLGCFLNNSDCDEAPVIHPSTRRIEAPAAGTEEPAIPDSAAAEHQDQRTLEQPEMYGLNVVQQPQQQHDLHILQQLPMVGSLKFVRQTSCLRRAAVLALPCPTLPGASSATETPIIQDSDQVLKLVASSSSPDRLVLRAEELSPLKTLAEPFLVCNHPHGEEVEEYRCILTSHATGAGPSPKGIMPVNVLTCLTEASSTFLIPKTSREPYSASHAVPGSPVLAARCLLAQTTACGRSSETKPLRLHRSVRRGSSEACLALGGVGQNWADQQPQSPLEQLEQARTIRGPSRVSSFDLASKRWAVGPSPPGRYGTSRSSNLGDVGTISSAPGRRLPAQDASFGVKLGALHPPPSARRSHGAATSAEPDSVPRTPAATVAATAAEAPGTRLDRMVELMSRIRPSVKSVRSLADLRDLVSRTRRRAVRPVLSSSDLHPRALQSRVSGGGSARKRVAWSSVLSKLPAAACPVPPGHAEPSFPQHPSSATRFAVQWQQWQLLEGRRVTSGMNDLRPRSDGANFPQVSPRGVLRSEGGLMTSVI